MAEALRLYPKKWKVALYLATAVGFDVLVVVIVALMIFKPGGSVL